MLIDKNNLKKVSVITIIFILFFSHFFIKEFIKNSEASLSYSQNHYIRAGANGDGNDWENAWSNLPSTFIRGHTYYIADGTYDGDHIFDTEESGSDYVNIIKATVSKHGDNNNWDDSYGDGVAVFNGSIAILKGYLNFDGISGGGPSNWTNGHGFEFTSLAGTNISYFNIQEEVSNIHLQHIAFSQDGDIDNYKTGANAIYNNKTLNNSVFEYLYFNNIGGLPFFFRGGTGNIIQYNYLGDICGMSVADTNKHCEAVVIWDMDNLQFRWNYISESPSSGAFVKNNSQTADSINIYGNYFQNGKAIVCNTGTCTNWRIYNNTINNGYGPVSGDGIISGARIYNNLVYNSHVIKLWPNHDYNWFSNSDVQCKMESGVHENITTNFPDDCDIGTENKNPFVNLTGDTPEDFLLESVIEHLPGTDICSLDNCDGENKFNFDAFKNIRGLDEIWDLGAYEYTLTTDLTKLPEISAQPESLKQPSLPTTTPSPQPSTSNTSSSGPTAPKQSSPAKNNNLNLNNSNNISSQTTPINIPDTKDNPITTIEITAKKEAMRIMENSNFIPLSEEAKKIYNKVTVFPVKPLNDNQKYKIAYFIHYGTPTTIKIGAGERGGSMLSFQSAFGKLPETEMDWQDVIKIANGRWTTQKNESAENKTRVQFRKIYKRDTNLNNSHDNTAIIVMTYGLRPAIRNIESEKHAIISFRDIYKKDPKSTLEWDIIRAIAYSGATR